MPLKIKGLGNNSENTFIKQVLYNVENDPNISNIDLNKIVFKMDPSAEPNDRWVRQFNISPMVNNSEYIDYDTVTVTVIGRNPCSGLSLPPTALNLMPTDKLSNVEAIEDINIIAANQLYKDQRAHSFNNRYADAGFDSELLSHLYYGDVINFSASPMKGYAPPQLSNPLGLLSVTTDINLDDLISSTGQVMSLSMPQIISMDKINPYSNTSENGGPVLAVIKNNNSFSCVLNYCMKHYKWQNEITADRITYDPIEMVQYDEKTVTLFGISNAAASAGNRWVLEATLVYGAAESLASTQQLEVLGETDNGYITESANTYLYTNGYPDTGNTESWYKSAHFTANSPLAEDGAAVWAWSLDNPSAFIIDHTETTTTPSTFTTNNKMTVIINENYNFSENSWTTCTITATATTSKGIVAVIRGYVYGRKYKEETSSGGGGGGGCISYDTKILMSNGTQLLAKDVKNGFMIAGYNSDHKLSPYKVINAYKSYLFNEIYKLNFVNNTYIKVTGDHPLLTNNGYKNIDGLKGYEKLNLDKDQILTINGYLDIKSIESVPNLEPVYNFYTECDNFIADDVIVACENPDDYEVGSNCFIEYERGLSNITDGSSSSTVTTGPTTGPWNPDAGGFGGKTVGTDLDITNPNVYTYHYDPSTGYYYKIEADGSYSYYIKGCVSADSEILLLNNLRKKAKDVKINDVIAGVDENGNIIYRKVLNIYYTDKCDHIYQLCIDGFTLYATGDHPILTNNGYKNIDGIANYEKLDVVNDLVYTTAGYRAISSYKQIEYSGNVYNFYTECDNFIADDVIVACENPDTFIEGVNCFTNAEGSSYKDIGGPSVIYD